MDQKYDYYLKSKGEGIHIGTFFYYAKEAGIYYDFANLVDTKVARNNPFPENPEYPEFPETTSDDETKKPRFQVIVEGANLFLSQEARLFLEKKGVVIFKDASANKGGVTSSSLEVLAALALNDEQIHHNTC